MTRICSKKGPRYPIYNDKQGGSAGCWEFDFTGSAYLPPPSQLFPPLPRPSIRTTYTIKQPKANMGFLRGNRTIKRREQNFM